MTRSDIHLNFFKFFKYFFYKKGFGNPRVGGIEIGSVFPSPVRMGSGGESQR